MSDQLDDRKFALFDTAIGICGIVWTVHGVEAVQLRVAEQYVGEFGKLAQRSNTIVVPANVSDLAGMITMAMGVYKNAGSPAGNGATVPPARTT